MLELSPVVSTDIRIDRKFAWPLGAERDREISAHWLARKRIQPRLFDGRLYLLRAWRLHKGVLSGECFETDYRSFLWCRDHGWPDASVWDLFGAAALHTSDDCLVLGEMSARTSSPGIVHFPCGSPTTDDVCDGRLALDQSLAREVREELGIELTPAQFGPAVIMIDGPRFGYIRPVRIDRSSAQVSEHFDRYSAAQDDPELASLRFVRGAQDIEPEFPSYVAAYVRRAFSPGPARAMKGELSSAVAALDRA